VLVGATSRTRLQTEVLLGLLRATALLAQQVATLDVMSGGPRRGLCAGPLGHRRLS
jgi:alkanesulfonate monooxygenase SsuD/methylene tetrahydromethanopterin reductase-like flavin-dependent oxidoreductase (luciferase family)